jgi:hypothetical protein
MITLSLLGKIIQTLGSGLFLTGALMFVFGSDTPGNYVYLTCATCYGVSSIIDVIDYYRDRQNNKDLESS